jgi:hypothetical protein
MDLDQFLAEALGTSTQHQKFYHFTDKKNLSLMRPKHSLDRLLTLKASGVHDLMAASQPTLWKKCL